VFDQSFLGGMRCADCRSGDCAHCRKHKAAVRAQGSRAMRPPLAEPANLLYVYDGSLAGFYCCVYESVYGHELPYSIVAQAALQPTLLPVKHIATDRTRALKVRDSVPRRLGQETAAMVEQVFYSCMEEKELALLKFLLLAYREDGRTLQRLGHPLVAPLLAAQKHFLNERHLLLGFIRFSDYDGVLAARITPKNFVLPYLAGHFMERFPQERLLIYDRTHSAALLCEQGRRQIIEVEHIDFPAASEEEEHYRALWKRFYHTIAIAARENPRCRMTHMPKRYWENMTELQDELQR